VKERVTPCGSFLGLRQGLFVGDLRIGRAETSMRGTMIALAVIAATIMGVLYAMRVNENINEFGGCYECVYITGPGP
jgi:hypothetical protein